MTPDQQAAAVEKQLDVIKASMPSVYLAIKAKAREIGGEAYALVRRGLRGEANCFYAFEDGHVMGTPFSLSVTSSVAKDMVKFGRAHVCMWAAPSKTNDGRAPLAGPSGGGPGTGNSNPDLGLFSDVAKGVVL